MSFEKENDQSGGKIEEGRWSSTLLLTMATLLYGVVPQQAGATNEGGSPVIQVSDKEPGRLANERLESKRQLLHQLLRKFDARETTPDDTLRRERKKVVDLSVRAQLSAERGDELSADKLFNEAISSASRLLRSLKSMGNGGAGDSSRYKELAENVTAFRESLIETAKERNLTEEEIDLDRIDALIHQAARKAGSGDYRQANRLLASAYQFTVASIARHRKNETVYHALDFETAQDEYRYEQQRYVSHQLLVQMILGEGTVGESSRERLSEHLRSAETLHHRAGEQWRNGEQRRAIETEEQAIRELIRALRIGGVYVPE
ncbi:MAG: hypothetical protein Kow006_09780 [Gammaproteobacteria bacterium]